MLNIVPYLEKKPLSSKIARTPTELCAKVYTILNDKCDYICFLLKKVNINEWIIKMISKGSP